MGRASLNVVCGMSEVAGGLAAQKSCVDVIQVSKNAWCSCGGQVHASHCPCGSKEVACRSPSLVSRETWRQVPPLQMAT